MLLEKKNNLLHLFQACMWNILQDIRHTLQMLWMLFSISSDLQGHQGQLSRTSSPLNSIELRNYLSFFFLYFYRDEFLKMAKNEDAIPDWRESSVSLPSPFLQSKDLKIALGRHSIKQTVSCAHIHLDQVFRAMPKCTLCKISRNNNTRAEE